MKLFSLELKSKLNRNLFRAKNYSWRDEGREKKVCKCQTHSFFRKVTSPRFSLTQQRRGIDCLAENFQKFYLRCCCSVLLLAHLVAELTTEIFTRSKLRTSLCFSCVRKLCSLFPFTRTHYFTSMHGTHKTLTKFSKKGFSGSEFQLITGNNGSEVITEQVLLRD